MKKEVKVGLFFLVALAIFSYLIIRYKHIEFGKKTYSIYTYFSTVSGIEINSLVKLSGFKVGRVVEIIPETDNNRIKVIMHIRNEVKIHKDAVARMQMDNVMGGKHISISFGKAKEYLQDNDYIISEDQMDIEKLVQSFTETSEDAKKLIKKFYEMLDENQLKVKSFIENIEEIARDSKPKINNILTYIDTAMPDLKKSLSNIENITMKIRDGKGTLGKAVNDPKLYEELIDSFENVKKSFARVENILARNEDNIDSIVVGLRDTIVPVKKSFSNLSDITDKIKRGEGTVGMLVNDTGLYTSAKKTIEKINENLEDQREQTIMSTFTGTILGIFKF